MLKIPVSSVLALLYALPFILLHNSDALSPSPEQQIPLSIRVFDTKPHIGESGISFVVEITSHSDEDLELNVRHGLTPFLISISDEKYLPLDNRRTGSRSFQPDNGQELAFKAREKKVFLMRAKIRQPGTTTWIDVPTGTYHVSVTLSVRNYSVGQQPISLDETAILSSDTVSTVSNDTGFLRKKDSDIHLEPILDGEISLGPTEVVWGRGESPLPKTVQIYTSDSSIFDPLSVTSSSEAFSTRLLSDKNAAKYQLEVWPTTTLKPVKAEILLKFGLNTSMSVISAVVNSEPRRLLPQTSGEMIKVNQSAPDFSVRDMNGNIHQLSALKGKKALLLTFFPKCFTGGCTNHLSSLRDQYANFLANDMEVLAVSVDPAEGDRGQKAFAKQWNLPFPLIPDTERKLSLLYGAVKHPTDLDRRMTVLIDKQGITRFIDTNVNVKTHGADMIVKMHELGMTK